MFIFHQERLKALLRLNIDMTCSCVTSTCVGSTMLRAAAGECSVENATDGSQCGLCVGGNPWWTFMCIRSLAEHRGTFAGCQHSGKLLPLVGQRLALHPAKDYKLQSLSSTGRGCEHPAETVKLEHSHWSCDYWHDLLPLWVNCSWVGRVRQSESS